jgi:hypothetical protein
MFKHTIFKTAAAVTLAGGLAIGSAVAAGAHVMDDPTPAPVSTDTVTPSGTPQFGYHPPRVRARDWQFDLRQSDGDGLSLNDVQGFGALAFSRWQNTDLSPNVSRFSLGGNSITLWHDSLRLADLDVNRRTCTINFDQHRGAFRILSATGIFAGARTVPFSGQFDLQGMISVQNVPVRHHKDGIRGRDTICPLVFRSDGSILRAVLLNRSLGGVVTMDSFSVQGDALVVRPRPVHPKPYVTPTEVAPTDLAPTAEG